MKKQWQHWTTGLVLAVYLFFSTGICVTIHHCCNHCLSSTVVEYCACESMDAHDGHGYPCGQNGENHHKCHDTHYLFKIIDSYDKDEYSSPSPPVLSCFMPFTGSESMAGKELQNLPKTFQSPTRSRSGTAIPCDSFFEYAHQLLFYA